MKKRYRLLVTVIAGLCAISSIVGYKLYSALYNHIMDESEVGNFIMEPVKGPHSLQLKLSITPNQNAFIVRAISIKKHGSTITVLFHLAKSGLAQPTLAWGDAYVLDVPESISDVSFGRQREVIWHRVKHSRMLKMDELEQTLHSNFTVVRKVSEVPGSIKADYTDLTGRQFGMANPGERMASDVIEPGVPNTRLVLAGQVGDREVLIYESGGFVNFLNVMVVIHGEGGGAWIASLDDWSVDSISGLNAAIQNGKYKVWPASD